MAEKSRRKLIKGLGISIPTAWAAPIIEAVILPAHATTSLINPGPPSALETHFNCGDTPPNPEFIYYPLTISPGNTVIIGSSTLSSPVMNGGPYIGAIQFNFQTNTLVASVVKPSGAANDSSNGCDSPGQYHGRS